MYADRIARFQPALERSPFDAIALIPGTNLLYLTGLNFHLMERPVVALFTSNAVPRFILPNWSRISSLRARSSMKHSPTAKTPNHG